MVRRPSRGVTLVEVLMAIAIMALLTGLAAPSFVDSVARSRLEGTVATLANDLQYARSESLRRRSNVTLATGNDDGGNFYAITDPNAPVAQRQLKKVYLPSGITLGSPTPDGQSVTAATPVVFNSLRGTAAATALVGESTKTSARLRVTVNALGRLAVCTTSDNMAGYTKC